MPVSGPVDQMILLAGDSGSTLGSISSTRYFDASPREPRYSLAHAMFSGSFLTVPAVRSTRRMVPAQDMCVLLRCQAAAWLPSLSAQAFMRSMPVQLASMKVMAPVGQASAQAGSPPHRSHFWTLPVSCT